MPIRKEQKVDKDNPNHRFWCVYNGVTFERLARLSLMIVGTEHTWRRKHFPGGQENACTFFMLYGRVRHENKRIELDHVINMAKVRLTNKQTNNDHERP